MDDTLYFIRRANQSLDQASRATGKTRVIQLELARRYAEHCQQASGLALVPDPPVPSR